MRIVLAFMSTMFLYYSCVVIGLTSDYNKLDADQKKQVIPLNNFEEAKDGFIHKINASQLKEDLIKYPKSIVYVFSAGCNSSECMRLAGFGEFADQNGYRLYLVLAGYSDLNKVLQQNINRPFFSIDDACYKTRYRSLYVRYFTNELMNLPVNTNYSQRKFNGSIFIYHYGQLINVMDKLPET